MPDWNNDTDIVLQFCKAVRTLYLKTKVHHFSDVNTEIQNHKDLPGFILKIDRRAKHEGRDLKDHSHSYVLNGQINKWVCK